MRVTSFVVLLALVASVEASSQELPPRARTLRDEAERLFRAQKYVEAAGKFESAYGVSEQPRFIFKIAFCYEKGGDLSNAYRFYEKFLLLGKSPTELKRARKHLRDLARSLKKTHGYLTVDTDPADADVLLDDATAPLERLRSRWLKAGEHEVVARRSGYLPKVVTVQLKPGQRLTVRVVLNKEMKNERGRVIIRSAPEGAKVWLGGTLVGKTPVSLYQLRAGVHQVRVEAPGHQSVRRTVNVLPGKLTEVRVALKPTQPPPPTPPGAESPHRISLKPGGSILTKWWFWTIIGAVVVGGVTAGVVLGLPEKTETEAPFGAQVSFP